MTVGSDSQPTITGPDSVSLGQADVPPHCRQVTRIGKYVLQELIADAGFSWVYLAQQTEPQRLVVVKVLKRGVVGSVADLKSEAQRIAELEHPNIITVYDAGFVSGQDENGASYTYYYLAMEYAAGDSLTRRLVEEKPLDAGEAVRIISQVAAGLDRAHSRRVIHRDIKPGNILFKDDGRVLLSDFGIALDLRRGETPAPGDIVGTVIYMSPEQARGRRLDARSDIFSLAVVLYQMLTGRVPFRADNPLATLNKIISEPPPPPRSINPHLPRALQRAVLKALSKEPDERFQTAGQFAQALTDALTARRRTTTTIGGALAAAAVIILLVAFPWSPPDPPSPSPSTNEGILLTRAASTATQQAYEHTKSAEIEQVADDAAREEQTAAAVAAISDAATATATCAEATATCATATAQWIEDHTAVVGTYRFDKKWQTDEKVTDGVTAEIVHTLDRVEYDGNTVTVHVSKVIYYSDKGNYGQFRKRADFDPDKYDDSDGLNPTIYLKDNMDRRYPLVAVGGEFREDVLMAHGQSVEGWYEFASPKPGGYLFSFHEDDQGVVIKDLELR